MNALKRIGLLLIPVLAITAIAMFLQPESGANAQVISFDNVRIGTIVQSHATVGTTTADAIADASVVPSLLAWKICNDAVNVSTHLIVGQAADVATDGIVLGLGDCFECPNCTPSTLKAFRVKGQAADNGYSIIQYRQQ